ncbi:MAG: hypothetical protein H6R24_1995, partial [Proteobacteria bacterium]|nr:hypothetical protein [Pseudomonadota bacterium]
MRSLIGYISISGALPPVTGEQVRWGMENLNITEARLKQIGAT